jgi:hypothetical protein
VIVAEHELVGPGDTSILDDHYDGPRPAPSRGPRLKTQAEKQFCTLGAEAEQFLVGAAAIGNTRLKSELDTLLGLGAAHGEQALVDALRRAVAFRRFRAADAPRRRYGARWPTSGDATRRRGRQPTAAPTVGLPAWWCSWWCHDAVPSVDAPVIL